MDSLFVFACSMPAMLAMYIAFHLATIPRRPPREWTGKTMEELDRLYRRATWKIYGLFALALVLLSLTVVGAFLLERPRGGL